MPKNADHLSYQRASTISAFGLAMQLALAVAMLVYGVLGGDYAATYGSIPMFFGVPIWIALLLVFHQHKLERLEAIETEAFRASDASQASVFDEVGADQVVQASRLAWMHRLLLPVFSVVIGIVAVVLGLILLFRTGPVELAADLNSGWGIAIGVACAFLGFVFARFVAGMARQPIWSLLNGGAGIAMAGALIGLLLAIGHFLDMALDERGLLETLPTVFRIFLLVYGIEVLANTVLNFYKPRRGRVPASGLRLSPPRARRRSRPHHRVHQRSDQLPVRLLRHRRLVLQTAQAVRGAGTRRRCAARVGHDLLRGHQARRDRPEDHTRPDSDLRANAARRHNR
ncbi:MAG: hypothetical protein ACFHWZ_16600 [Phycisphaerales bacterium]